MPTKGQVTGVVSNLVTVKVDGPVSQNEICYIRLNETVLLRAEVIKILGERIYVQAFDSTRGLKTGAPVDFKGHMLEVDLGPGMLSKVYDGLQNDLYGLDMLFLEPGAETRGFDLDAQWAFTPIAQVGDRVRAGDWIGEVKENWIAHKIMVPFVAQGFWEVEGVSEEGSYAVRDTVARLKNADGAVLDVTMAQRWPVKVPLRAYASKSRPHKLLQTGVRVMDTFNPMMEGGTGFIPGPFGSGKTVLQHIIAAHAQVDLVIVAACGERANEVVELFKEFPKIKDPHTGRKLMERTIIICNTSNMPVSAREASVYTAMTIAEYYRQMGLKILLLADSTSRWAQALREMSNRLEELPGPDAFPMDLPAVIANFYARAGITILNNEATGSITFIGTVSPAGGNLKEPVTEATKKVARCFYALAQARADSKRYPAIDPIASYSKYLEYAEVEESLNRMLHSKWTGRLAEVKDILIRGKEAHDQINILGDDSVPVAYHERFWKAELVDFGFLQQDAFDVVDRATDIERQRYMFDKIYDICVTDMRFEAFDEVAGYFKRLIHLVRQMNYSEFQKEDFKKYEDELHAVLEERRK